MCVVPVVPVSDICSFHMFRLCFCMSEVISLFRNLRTGSQVFALLMLFLCVSLHTISLGKSLQFFFLYRKNLLQEIQQKRSSHLYNIYNLPFSID